MFLCNCLTCTPPSPGDQQYGENPIIFREITTKNYNFYQLYYLLFWTELQEGKRLPCTQRLRNERIYWPVLSNLILTTYHTLKKRRSIFWQYWTCKILTSKLKNRTILDNGDSWPCYIYQLQRFLYQLSFEQITDCRRLARGDMIQ